MSIIIQNKLVLYILFLEKYQIDFFEKHEYIKKKLWLLIECLVNIEGLTKWLVPNVPYMQVGEIITNLIVY